MFMKQQIEEIVQKRIEHIEKQRAELLDALQKLHSVALGSVELDDWRELQDALDWAMQAINRTEAAE